MSFVYLPEQVVDSSQASGCLGGEPSATSNGINTASKSCKQESEMGCSTTLRYGMTLEHSTGDPGVDAWILSLRDSRASHSVSPASEREQTTKETCGPIQSGSYARYDHDTHSWRTSQVCLFQDTTARFSETWPRAGTMQDGECYRRQKWELRIREIGCGLLPTPRTLNCDYWTQEYAIHKAWLCDSFVGGELNPTWVEWLMGWPLGWTDLKPLATDRFRSWLQQHGICSQETK